MNEIYNVLLKASIGGSNIGSDTTKAVQGLNEILTSLGTAVGGIICIVAFVKLALALASESASEKEKGSMLLGIGIFFISISTIWAELGLDSGSAITEATVASKMASIIGTICSFGAAGCAILGTYDLIVAFTSEQAEQKVNAIKLYIVAVALGSVKSLANNMSFTSGNSVVSSARRLIGSAASYGGGALAAIGAFYIINGIRNEDGRERDTGIRLAVAGAGMIGARVILGRIV